MGPRIREDRRGDCYGNEIFQVPLRCDRNGNGVAACGDRNGNWVEAGGSRTAPTRRGRVPASARTREGRMSAGMTGRTEVL